MRSKANSEIRQALETVNDITYIRIWCVLSEPHLSDVYREKLSEMFCTHLMQTAFLCSVEIPRRYFEEVVGWDVVKTGFEFDCVLTTERISWA